ncbi:type IV pilus twitching motility protein PilT [Cronbergia sp. UHCC 0137]|uniref:type IV pilus twitching motility protein PilT n=1 Tax=Cronbergia sp. UHCC 0137 TaxID=3110239 RepID=UPI002B20C761|nr:type IV pilus twitching motility protein PilT [Cronbergia sp. UHCC 0137]MEA5616517.1 type IV pilus twitching motility protein PilT [Cronbergia sp. UHCC 0137]
MAESPPRNLPPTPPPPPPMASRQQQAQQPSNINDRKANTVADEVKTPIKAETTIPRAKAALPTAETAPVAAQNLGKQQQPPPPPITTTTPKSPTQTLTLAYLVQEAFDQGYSDVHLGVGEVPRFRNRGEIQMTDYPKIDKETFIGWLREIMTDAEIQRFQDTLEFDGATQYEFARVRINIFDSLRGYAMVLRLIPLKILSMEQLKLPPIFREICHYHKGFILVTGPTGSGKSTTMAAMVDYINREMPKHIISIEDPIEFVHESRKSLIKQREVGMHTRKFDNALKAALREDPDLIIVGEMRDKETVNTALKAAQTGHLVMGTLHTNSAVKTIERILNLYAGEEQDAMRVAISESLVSVIAQGLCRTTDGKRAAFHDILINNEAVKEWIKDGKYDEITELMKQASYDGMITMNQSLFNLYQDGRITEETALEMSPTPNEMAQFLRGRV